MNYYGKYDVLGLKLTACDHGYIVANIKKHIVQKKNLLITPLASQTFILALLDNNLKLVLDAYDHLFSDSLWVKRSINFLYNIQLKDRIRGSNFLLQICKFSEQNGYKVFFYGTTKNTLDKLTDSIIHIYPRLKVVGKQPSKFGNLTLKEKSNLINQIEKSGAELLLIALGSPLEQVFSYELLFVNPKFKKNIIVIPFGAAFDFVAGVKPTAPLWMQQIGIEWFYRFLCEPRRLWKRYIIYGSLFVLLVIWQKVKILLNISNNVVSESKMSS